jgi:hypothetical protein
VSNDPYEKKPRKPVAVTLVPNFVVASDRAVDEDHQVIEEKAWALL